MKRTLSWELVVLAFFLGAALAMLLVYLANLNTKLSYHEVCLAGQDARLALLEKERAERLQSEQTAKGLLGFATRCLKITWNLIRKI